ncbi:DUF1799 domain-containing protein [Vogesella sp. XCS3]|uniref:DUF1799 domain-containing protein n=1 Tax=Vogesella sp. XCS3 TaxID=2877939 RepID=UPI001D0A00F2|nr:DUF1799 domain-containing protein [Vogesella sp. XCS3]UDM18749.1 DUF1799 domain-containing protein [Vogesella sp. XCS3]
MTADDVAAAPVEVWPDVWPAVLLLRRLRTQWRVGMGGAVGLDYSVMYWMMDRMELDKDAYDQLEADIQVMEDEVLAMLAEGKE